MYAIKCSSFRECPSRYDISTQCNMDYVKGDPGHR